MRLAPLVRALVTCLLLLLTPLPQLSHANEDAGSSKAVPRTSERVTAGELLEMSPADRRALFQEVAPGIPMPANFGTDELDGDQEQLSDQYYQGMADTLKLLS